MNKEEFFTMSFHRLDELIIKEFNLDRHGFSCVTDWEIGNDTWKVIRIDGKPDDYYKNEEPGYGRPQYYMNCLARDGKIPTGKYLIEICW